MLAETIPVEVDSAGARSPSVIGEQRGCGKKAKASRVCGECGRWRPHHAHGLCRACYWRTRYIPVPRTASDSPWTPHIHDAMCLLWEGGRTMAQIARTLRMTKNQIAGRLYRFGLLCPYDGPTTTERLQALHGRMDAVLKDYGQRKAAGMLYVKASVPNVRFVGARSADIGGERP